MSGQGCPSKRALALSIGAFCGIAFAYSWVLWTAMWIATGRHDPAFKIAAMYGPALAFLAVRAVRREGFGDAGFSIGCRPVYAIAWFSVPLISLAASAISALFGAAELGWNPCAELATPFLSIDLPTGAPDVWTVALRVALALSIQTLILAPFTFGEDLGWFGHLVPRLRSAAGRLPTAWMFGCVWALWHLPIVYLGHNNPDRTTAGLLFALGWTVLMGVCLAWLRIVSRSLWAPALAHATLDASGTIGLMVLDQVSISSWMGAFSLLLASLALPASLHLSALDRQERSGARAGTRRA